jgi:putative acetyltransferase
MHLASSDSIKTLPMYTLTTPAKTDYPILLTIWEASVRATHHFLRQGDIEFFKKIIQEEKVFDLVELTVVQDQNGEILGFMGVAGESLEMIFLAPKARGRGIGKLLMQHALKDWKITKVDVNEQNEAALRFYECFGFEIVGRSALDGTGKPYPILHMQLSV